MLSLLLSVSVIVILANCKDKYEWVLNEGKLGSSTQSYIFMHYFRYALNTYDVSLLMLKSFSQFSVSFILQIFRYIDNLLMADVYGFKISFPVGKVV